MCRQMHKGGHPATPGGDSPSVRTGMFAAPPGAAGAPRQWGRQPGRRPVGAPALAGGDSPGKAVWGHHEVGALRALAARRWDVADPCEGRAPCVPRRASARVADLIEHASAKMTCRMQGALPSAGVGGGGVPATRGRGLAPSRQSRMGSRKAGSEAPAAGAGCLVFKCVLTTHGYST